MPPVAVSTGQATYPTQEEILHYLKHNSSQIIRMNATRETQELGSVKVLNIFMIGVLASLLPVSPEVWEESIKKFAPPKFLDLNLKAFRRGYEQYAKVN
ncbi:MAG: 2-oxoacid:acceptor oxidoreductase family protein [Spirochaetales bacterium]